MEKIKNFFKGKKVAFYIMMADAFLAFVVGILFLATKGMSLANSASTHQPDLVWVFAFAGVILEIAALIVPKYKWVHLFALAFYCLSFSKELELIPPVIADQVTGVHFQGGSFAVQLIYLILLVIIVASAIYVAFVNVLTDEAEEAEPKINEKKGIIRAGSAGAVGVVGLIFALVLAFTTKPTQKVEKVYDPLKAFESLVIDYEHEPMDVVFRQNADEGDLEKNPYEGKTNSEISTALNNREGHWLVYEFEGKYTEAYHDSYNYDYYSIQVYEDGVFKGSNNHQGYWYNVNEDGIDCLVLKATSGNDMVCRRGEEGSPYMWYTDMKASQGGARTCKMNGYAYYPIIGIYIDTKGEITKEGQVLEYEKGAEFSHDNWTVMIVRNNLKASAVFNDSQITWKDLDTSVEGEQTITATWKDFKAEIKAVVK